MLSLARRGLRDRGPGEPRAAADARRQLDAHPRRQRDSPDGRLEAVARGARRARRDRFRHDVRAGRSHKESGSGRCRAASASSSAASSAPRPSASSKSCRRRCASSRAATTACAATTSRRSAPSTRTATSSAARRSRRAASSSSSRCARAGRSRSSSTPATRSRARRSTRRRASASAAAGSRRSGRSASISRCRSTTTRRLARARHAGARPMRWLKRSAIASRVLAVVALAGAAATACSGSSARESGTAWLVRRLVAAAPQITIERVRGSLLDGLRSKACACARRATSSTSTRSRSTGTARRCSTGMLAFTRADAARATYRRVPGVAAGGGGPPELPWPLRIEEASVATLIDHGRRAHAAVRRHALRGHLRRPAGSSSTTSRRHSATPPSPRTPRSSCATASSSTSPANGRPRSRALPASGSVELTRHLARRCAIRHELAAPFAATTTGTLVVGARSASTSSTQWQRPRVAGRRTASRARAAGSRSPARWTTIATTAAGALDVAGRAATFTVDGTGAATRARARAARARAGGAAAAERCAAAGSVTSRAATRASRSTANRFDPAWIVAAWPGRLDGTARAARRPRPRAERRARRHRARRRAARLSRHAGRRGGIDGARPRPARRASPRLRIRTASC